MIKNVEKISKIAYIALLAATVLFAAFLWVIDTFKLYAFLLFGRSPWYVVMYLAIAALVAMVLANLTKTLESLRRLVVALKRSPQTIPLVTLLITFVLYSFNLTKMSDTTALVQGKNMGLCQFVMMLFTLLSMVCMLNAFPKRKKPNYAMVILMFAMFAACFGSAILYQQGIMAAITREVSPIDYVKNAFVAEANNMLNTYMILLGVTAVLVVLMPVYSKLLRKINTSVAIEDNGDMEEIEISE